jgi:hypothetical protein
MKIPSCSRPVWKRLYAAAGAFEDIACWDWMSDTDVFGVQNPDNRDIGYCCVLGELGEVFGLVVYLGSEGLEQHRKIQSGKIHAGSPDFAASQNCLTAWFGDRSDLDSADLKVIKGLGLKFRGSEAWPQFRSLQPGYLPWYLTEGEAKFLTLCLEQASQVAIRFKNDPEWLIAPSSNRYLVRVPVEGSTQTDNLQENFLAEASSPSVQQLLFNEFDEPKVWQWQDQWLMPAPVIKASVHTFPLDEVRLQRIKTTVHAHRGVWEIDAFYTPTPVDGDNRPFFPYSLLCADHDSGLIFDTVLGEPAEWEAQFSKSLLDCIVNCNFVPNALWVRKEALRQLFEPLAAALSIEILSTTKLPAVDRAKRELLKFLKHRS